jgi:uncharacterized phage infection (PIP) family protein YhgE
VEYCKSEVQELTKEVSALRDEANKYKEMTNKSKEGIKNANKIHALEQIQELIKMHKKHDF